MNQLEIYKLQKSLQDEKAVVDELTEQVERLESQVSGNLIVQTGEPLEVKELKAQIKEFERRIAKKKLKIATFKENEKI